MKEEAEATSERKKHLLIDAWNAYMNFVVYWYILPRIYILYNIIIMFYVDLSGFTNDPPYFGYNSAEYEFPILCIFISLGPKQSQIDLDFF
jgi:hypothetical protein